MMVFVAVVEADVGTIGDTGIDRGIGGRVGTRTIVVFVLVIGRVVVWAVGVDAGVYARVGAAAAGGVSDLESGGLVGIRQGFHLESKRSLETYLRHWDRKDGSRAKGQEEAEQASFVCHCWL